MDSHESIALAQVLTLFTSGVGVGFAGAQLLSPVKGAHTIPVGLSCAALGLIVAAETLHWGVWPLLMAVTMGLVSAARLLVRSLGAPGAEPRTGPNMGSSA